MNEEDFWASSECGIFTWTINDRAMLVLAVILSLGALVQGRQAPVGIDGRVLAKLDGMATEQHLVDAVRFGEEVVEMSKRMESMIAGSRVKVVKGSITHGQIIDGRSTASSQKQDYVARTVLSASSFFLNSYCKPGGIPAGDCGRYLEGEMVPKSKLLDKCLKIVDRKTYNDEYRRLLPASYKDGIYEIRKSVKGGELPDPRSISRRFHGAVEKKDSTRTVALVQWTQFIEQDLAKTTVQTMHDGTDIECCSSDHSPVLPRYRHPACKPLMIAENDPHYKTQGVTCLNYVRSALSLGDSCHFGAANQLNQATNRLDLSQLYGNHETETMPLRTLRGGKLKSETFDSSEFLSESPDRKLCLTNGTLDVTCYQSGDTRVNVNPYVTVLHTLFLRSHNRIAKHLALANPAWTDQQLFEVARKINIKIYQSIVRDWTRAVLGSSISSVNRVPTEPRVSNEFATAGIRFYNTMMPGEIANPVATGRYQVPFELDDLFYKPKDLRKKEYFAHLIASVLQQNAMAVDTSYVDDLAQQLFKTKNVGTDGLALDIQRGRDHGLSPYTKYYNLCNPSKPINSWADLTPLMTPQDISNVQSAYASVHDVDLLIGSLAEIPTNPEATVGPTLSCIIKDQIANSLNTEHKHPTDDAVVNYSAARFLCDTAQLEQVQRDIFRLPSDSNPMERCSQLPALDLSKLRDLKV